MIKKIMLLVLPLLIFSCGTQSKMEIMKKISFHTIAQSTLHGNGQEGIERGLYVIKNKKEWKNLLEKMKAVNDETSKFEIPPIDFNKEMVLAVFSEVLSSGGVKIRINRIIETSDSLVVYSLYNTPESNIAIMVMNQPYHIIKLPKIDKPVQWKVEKK